VAPEAAGQAPKPGIRTKGWRGGLLVHLPSEGDWPGLLETLSERLAQTRDFWEDAVVTLDLGDRDLPTGDLDHLWQVLREEFALDPKGLVSSRESLRVHAAAHDMEAWEAVPAATPKPTPPDPRNQTIYHKGTVRSGVVMEAEGNIVIVGDVNAGGVVRAGGDIVVFGTLRGVAQAGASGDLGAQILATNLRPTQLRIGALIARSPDGGQPPLSKSPEKALVDNGEIRILPL
jgi:septum site-determining protein MinC